MNRTLPASASPAGGRARRRPPGEATPYDFRRPIQLSREHARILQLSLDGLARQATTLFTSALRTVCEVSLQSVEQRSYAEYIDSLDAMTYMTKFTVEPMPGVGVVELPLVATMACIDHMLGGFGAEDQPERPLTDIESGIISGLVERLLGEMRYALTDVVPVEPVVTGQEYSPQFAQIAAGADVMVVATFALAIGERSHRLTLCLPFGGLLPHLSSAAAPAPVSDRERAKRDHSAALLRAQFDKVPVDITVQLRGTRVTPEVLTDLAAGDVLRLSHPASAPLDVCVADTVFAHATPGARGPRLAALIVATPQEDS